MRLFARRPARLVSCSRVLLGVSIPLLLVFATAAPAAADGLGAGSVTPTGAGVPTTPSVPTAPGVPGAPSVAAATATSASGVLSVSFAGSAAAPAEINATASGPVSSVFGAAAVAGSGSGTDSAGPATPRMLKTLNVREGIDVSHWQARINWPRVARSGIDFMIAKATQGRGRVDHWYQRNYRRARAAGVRVTAYHYATPHGGRRDAYAQADFFIHHAHLSSSDLVPALDLEVSGGLSPRALQRWTLAWLHRVESRLGVKPIVYTSLGFWRGNMNNTTAVAKAGFRVLWLASWNTQKPSVPAGHWSGSGWTIWQWTKCGHVAGITGCVDRDALVGARLRDLTIASRRKH